MRYVWMLALVLLPTLAIAQTPQDSVPFGDEEVPIVARSGPAVVLLTEGPTLPTAQYRGEVHYRWFVVQDSTTGVVFRKRGGFKADGSGTRFDGDIDILITRDITAIEFGVATFNVWNEFTGAWFVTDIRRSEPEEEFDLNPRKLPCRADADASDGVICYSINKHYTSIIWVSRIRYADGSIVIKDPQPVLAAIKTFSDEVEPEELQPEEPLMPQVPADLTDI